MCRRDSLFSSSSSSSFSSTRILLFEGVEEARVEEECSEEDIEGELVELGLKGTEVEFPLLAYSTLSLSIDEDDSIGTSIIIKYNKTTKSRGRKKKGKKKR